MASLVLVPEIGEFQPRRWHRPIRRRLRAVSRRCSAVRLRRCAVFVQHPEVGVEAAVFLHQEDHVIDQRRARRGIDGHGDCRCRGCASAGCRRRVDGGLRRADIVRSAVSGQVSVALSTLSVTTICVAFAAVESAVWSFQSTIVAGGRDGYRQYRDRSRRRSRLVVRSRRRDRVGRRLCRRNLHRPARCRNRYARAGHVVGDVHGIGIRHGNQQIRRLPSGNCLLARRHADGRRRRGLHGNRHAVDSRLAVAPLAVAV